MEKTMIKGSKCREEKQVEIVLRRRLIEDFLDEHGVRSMLVGEERKKMAEGPPSWAVLYPDAFKIRTGLKQRKIEDIQDESLRMEVEVAMVLGIDPRKNAGGDAWSSTTNHRDLDALLEEDRTTLRQRSRKLLARYAKRGPAQMKLRRAASSARRSSNHVPGATRSRS